MLGAITGDIIGSAYEFNNYKAKDFQPLFHPECRYTDDTIMTIAVADILLNNKPVAETIKKWGREYFNKGSWGKQFVFWLSSKTIKEAYNSFGNGSAMRVSACAWLAINHEHAIDLAVKVSEVTHNHSEGIKDACAITSAIFWANEGRSGDDIKKAIEETYKYDLSRSIEEIRLNNPHSESCQKTVPEAITCAVESTGFEDTIRNAISIGGDSDTIAAMAGSIAEAIYGISDDIQKQTISMLPEKMINIITKFNQDKKCLVQ